MKEIEKNANNNTSSTKKLEKLQNLTLLINPGQCLHIHNSVFHFIFLFKVQEELVKLCPLTLPETIIEEGNSSWCL